MDILAFSDNEVLPLTAGQRPLSVSIETHGCKLNQADSNVLAREFALAGFRIVANDEPSDVYVVNSCTVTHVADRKARHSLRAARRRNPGATIVATGCYAQRAPGDLRGLEEVDIVAGNTAKPALVRRVVERMGGATQPCAVGDDVDLALSPRAVRTRAMVKIQEGCDQVCAYCIVPKVRGRERSIPAGEIVAEVHRNLERGHKEIVLTGTQLGSYGFDLDGETLAGLLRRVLRETDVSRLRLSSLQPQDIDAELLDLWADPRLCPHFHLPLQSGSDPVLHRMRRRYTAEGYADAVGRIRAAVPAVSITADVIVGFPGEEDADFEASYALCESQTFADIHVFPYSVRPGTSAAHFDGLIDPREKAARVGRLLSLAKRQFADFRRAARGQVRPVLWEERRAVGETATWYGLTDNYLRATVSSARNLANVITPARLGELSDDGTISAEIARPTAAAGH